MGVGVRNFVFEETGRVKRIPQTRIDRLLRSEESIPRHAGERLRIATVFLEMRDRRPVSAFNYGFWLLHFDPLGYIDEKKEFEGLRLAMNILTGGGVERDGKVLDISARLYERRYRVEHTWTPTPEEWDKLADLVGDLTASPTA
jgi:hypothetical protein